MSQRDLVAELRAARMTAPAEVRERVRLIAANAEPTPPGRFLRRRSLVLLVPLAAALAGAIVLTRPSGHPHQAGVALGSRVEHAAALTPDQLRPARSQGLCTRTVADTGAAVRRDDRRACQLTGRRVERRQEGAADHEHARGHPTSVHASAAGKAGTADLVLRIPRRHVQEAVTRLSQLGTITSEQVDIQDLQAGLDTTDRRITRLQHQLATLRTEPQTPERDRAIAAVTAQVERLQRNEASTVRSAQFATVRLHVATAPPPAAAHHGHGPLHGIGVAAYWAGVGAVYALAFGVPLLILCGLVLLAARAVRRRRVDALLSRP